MLLELELVAAMQQLPLSEFIQALVILTNRVPVLLIIWGAVVANLLVQQQHRRAAVSLVAALGLHYLLTELLLKEWVGIFRLRPYLAAPEQIKGWGELLTSSSFPSGHMTSIGSFLVVMGAYFQPWKRLALPLILYFTWSRLYLGMHYPSDVMVGIVLGAAYGWVVLKAVGILRQLVTAKTMMSE